MAAHDMRVGRKYLKHKPLRYNLLTNVCRTGTELRETLPLWKTRAMATPLRGTSRAIYVLRPLPHRHRIAGIAAVVSYPEKS